jgi:hypothetical protein
MAYCSNCGKELNAQQDVCLSCGRSVSGTLNRSVSRDQKANNGWGVLGFFFPLIGFILYLVWKDSDPVNSNLAGKGALYGVVIGFIFGVFLGLLG